VIGVEIGQFDGVAVWVLEVHETIGAASWHGSGLGSHRHGVTGGANLLGGIAVTSHDPSALFGVLADHVSIRSTTRTNLLTRGNFEDYNPPALNPAWTLIHEMLFYWFFVIYLVARRAFLPAVCVWLALICVNVWAKPALLPFWRTFLDPMNIEFIVGMGCAWAVTRLDPRHGLKLLFGGVVVATASFLLVLNHAPQYLFGVALAPLVVGFVLIEPRIRHRIPKLAILAGDASYSIYLIHNPAISILARTISGLAPLTATMVLSVLASAAGFVYYVVFERPALRAVRLLMPAAARPVSS